MVVGSQARILYSDQRGRTALALRLPTLKLLFTYRLLGNNFFYFIHFRNVGVGGLEVGVKDEVNP